MRLLAIDVDGTLLDLSGHVRPRVETAVRSAIASGCEVVLATGRRLQSVEPIARQLGITTVILTDGTVVYDFARGRAIYERTLSPELLRRGVALSISCEISPIIYQSPTVGARMIAGLNSIDLPETLEFLEHRRDVVRLPTEELYVVQRAIAIISISDEPRVTRLASAAEQIGGFTMVRWFPSRVGYHYDTVTFAPPGTSKGHALRWLAAERGIAIEATLAIGDYENDVSLIAAAGFGVAMGNAVESVKQVAQAIVTDNEHDGVAVAIERWVLGTERDGG